MRPNKILGNERRGKSLIILRQEPASDAFKNQWKYIPTYGVNIVWVFHGGSCKSHKLFKWHGKITDIKIGLIVFLRVCNIKEINLFWVSLVWWKKISCYILVYISCICFVIVMICVTMLGWPVHRIVARVNSDTGVKGIRYRSCHCMAFLHRYTVQLQSSACTQYIFRKTHVKWIDLQLPGSWPSFRISYTFWLYLIIHVYYILLKSMIDIAVNHIELVTLTVCIQYNFIQ